MPLAGNSLLRQQLMFFLNIVMINGELKAIKFVSGEKNTRKKVPKEGIEPSLPKEHEFESCASTSSATLANGMQIYRFYWVTQERTSYFYSFMQ